MGRSLALVVAFTALIMSASPKLQGAETVWSGLVIAENVPQPQPIPPELNRIEGSLKKLFGYNQFQVIGQSRKMLNTGQEDWLATSKFFGLHVGARCAVNAVDRAFRARCTYPNRGEAAYKNIAFGDRDPPPRLQMQSSAQV